jgi:hypothetical protein
MIMDYSKFYPGMPPLENFLTIIEEIPGFTRIEDVTKLLNVSFLSQFNHIYSSNHCVYLSVKYIQKNSYWASFNSAFFEDIQKYSGQDQICAKDSDQCFSNDPRNLIFAQRHKSVKTVNDLKWLMGYNGYEKDPLSKGDPCNVRPSQCDL